MASKVRVDSPMPWLVILALSYAAKRKLLSEWNKSDRTGSNDLTMEGASYLVIASAPWDLTVGLLTPERNVIVGDWRHPRKP